MSDHSTDCAQASVEQRCVIRNQFSTLTYGSREICLQSDNGRPISCHTCWTITDGNNNRKVSLLIAIWLTPGLWPLQLEFYALSNFSTLRQFAAKTLLPVYKTIHGSEWSWPRHQYPDPLTTHQSVRQDQFFISSLRIDYGKHRPNGFIHCFDHSLHFFDVMDSTRFRFSCSYFSNFLHPWLSVTLLWTLPYDLAKFLAPMWHCAFRWNVFPENELFFHTSNIQE